MSATPPPDPVDFAFPGTELVDPSAVFAGPGYEAPRIRTDPLAVTALVLALIFFVPLVPLAGAVLGAWALRVLPARRRAGYGLAVAAAVLGAVITVLQALIAGLYVLAV